MKYNIWRPEGLTPEQLIEFFNQLPYEAQNASIHIPNSTESNIVKYARYDEEENQIVLCE